MSANILLCCSVVLAVLRFDNAVNTVDTEPDQSVLECTLSDELDKAMAGLEGGSTDVWNIDDDEKKMVVRVTKESKDAIIGTQGVSCEVVIEDVDKYLEENMAKEQPKRNTRDDSLGRIQVYDFNSYVSYADIMAFYDDEIVTPYGTLASKTDIGGTYKQNRMYAIRITATTPPGDDDPPTPKIYLQCLIHAREWISGPVCMYIAKTLCEEYTKDDGDEEVKELMNTMEFVIVPVVNPDGYEYSREPDDEQPHPTEGRINKRLWRKNLGDTKMSYCPGADINRNFAIHWNENPPSASENECNYNYPGIAEASEMETQNIVNLMTGLGNILAAVDFHCYAKYIIRPYGYVNQKAPDDTRMKEISKQMLPKIRAVNRETYKTKKAYELEGKISGLFIDWAYDGAIKTTNGPRIASYAIELRPRPQSKRNFNRGFLLPENEILPTCKEIFPAIVHLAKTIQETPLPSPSPPAPAAYEDQQ